MSVLGDVMLTRGGSVQPAEHPTELFELYSIRGHDSGGSELVLGSTIGSGKQVVQPGDVLVSKIVPHIRRARVVGPLQGARQVASGEWIVFRGDTFDPGYLRQYLLSDRFHRQFMNTVAGVGGSLVRARPAHVKSIELPLPSLDEQRRIAAILDHADALRAKLRQVLAHLDDLAQSIFHDTFGGAVWSQQLADLAGVQIGPFGSLLHKEDYVEGGVPVLNPMHIQSGELVLDLSFSVSPEKATALAPYALEEGDVLLGRRGEMGRAAVVGPQAAGAICGTGSIVLRPRNVDSEVLWALVSSPRMKRHLERESLGSTLPNLNAKIVSAAPVPAVDHREQARFAHARAALRSRTALSQQAARLEDELFASLQSRAFAGEL